MNAERVKLPFSDIEIEQLPGGHAVTEAADYLQQTVVSDYKKAVHNGLELGSGNGVVTFMLMLRHPQWKLTGLEIQKELVDLAERNNARLGLNCRFRLGDLREHRSLLDYQGYDLVYSNPPWVKQDSGKISPDFARAMSRHEVNCTMRDVLNCLEWCLAPGGAAYVVYPVERKTELGKEAMRMELEVSNLFETEAFPRIFVAKLRRKSFARQW